MERKGALTYLPVVWTKLQKMEQNNVNLVSIMHFRELLVHYFNQQCKLKPHGPFFKMALFDGKTRKQMIHLR